MATEVYDVFIQLNPRKSLNDPSTIHYEVALTPDQALGLRTGFASLEQDPVRYYVEPRRERPVPAQLDMMGVTPNEITRYPTINGLNVSRNQDITQLGRYPGLGRYATAPNYPYYARLSIPGRIQDVNPAPLPDDLLMPMQSLEVLQGILTAWQWLSYRTNRALRKLEDANGNLLLVNM